MTHNKIHFNWITIRNFFSIGGEIKLDFNLYTGMNYVYGFNKDTNAKNGSGKCVDGNTKIDISIEDANIAKMFEEFVNNND